MIAYSYPGMYIRHIIAAVHFKHNLNRKVVTNSDGSEQLVVVYPKFKNGEATVRDVKVAANICHVEDMYQTLLDAQRKGDLEEEKGKLKKMTPEPINTMLTKQPRDEAIKKRKEKKG
ncbi:Hypothetical predicted protein [Paramuricea clavata]|uniref:Uncharacterized protein n=1 Tax=Paramuricea clavata TaxID=317549 RepID=A0A6S7JI32_PARCT|nr:Hypothetical predicted protein [Paramuricea clavata]